ncbi:Ccr4-Not Transcription Complex Subunit 1 [Manis pentadactyla]|nr:Ccr4-Not Transcription Complex Subunit 1 [Manis pentadactyla]
MMTQWACHRPRKSTYYHHSATHEAMDITIKHLMHTSDTHSVGVIVLSPLALHNAVGGTDNGLGLTRKRANGHDSTFASRHLPVQTGPHTRTSASPPTASSAHQTATVQAVIVRSPLDAHGAVGGTDDGLGPTPKSDNEPMGTPPPSLKAPTTDPLAPDKAMGSKSAGLNADADAQDERVDMMPPWLAVILRSPQAPDEAVGSTTAGPNSDNDS